MNLNPNAQKNTQNKSNKAVDPLGANRSKVPVQPKALNSFTKKSQSPDNGKNNNQASKTSPPGKNFIVLKKKIKSRSPPSDF